MRLSGTLSSYLTRQFVLWLVSVFFGLMGIAAVFDTVEMMRRSSGKDDVTIDLVLQMTLLKLPHLIEKLLPFVILFSAMMAFWRLARANEIVVARAAGVSVWQFILPAVFVTLMFGTLHITVLNPFASVLLSKFEQMEAKYLKRRTSMLAVSDNGLWLRQNDGRGQSVIHALRVSDNTMLLNDVIIFLYEGSDRFVGRIDAESARLNPGFWDIKDAWISGPDQPAHHVDEYKLRTELTRTKIQDSFASPETMSFWELPAFISTLEDAGFSGHRHRLHYYALIAYPALLCAMVLIAATFTLRITRRSQGAFAIAACVSCSFVLYFMSDVIHALGLSANVPPLLAAWTPAGVAVLLGTAMLLHREDG